LHFFFSFASFLLTMTHHPLTLMALLCSFDLHLPSQAFTISHRYRPVSFVPKPINDAQGVRKWNRLLSTATDTETEQDEAVREKEGRKDAGDAMAQLEYEQTDNDFVFVGDQSSMENDSTLRLVSSEVSIWKNLRKEAPPKTGLPLGLLLERTWDTAEDVFMHLRRIPYEKGWSELTTEEEVTRKTIVVLGSGWAAHALMKVADCNKLRLIVASPSNHFVFTPMLASAAVGTVEFRSM
jgi:hypothetical protein